MTFERGRREATARPWLRMPRDAGARRVRWRRGLRPTEAPPLFLFDLDVLVACRAHGLGGGHRVVVGEDPDERRYRVIRNGVEDDAVALVVDGDGGRAPAVPDLSGDRDLPCLRDLVPVHLASHYLHNMMAAA